MIIRTRGFQGHFEEMQLIVKFMNSNRVGKRQNLVFSATLTMDPHLPERVMEKSKKKLGRLDQLKALMGMTKPKIIDTTRKIGRSSITHVYSHSSLIGRHRRLTGACHQGTHRTHPRYSGFPPSRSVSPMGYPPRNAFLREL